MSRLTNSYIRITLFLLWLPLSFVYAQDKYKGNYDVLFASGKRTFEANLTDFIASPNVLTNDYVLGYTYVYLQFYDIPTQTERGRIDEAGVILLDYIPHKVYIAAIPEAFNWQLLGDWGVRTVMKITANDKLDQSVLGPYYENWADFGDEVEVVVQYHKNLSDDALRQMLIQEGFLPTSEYKTQTYIQGKVNKASLYELASLPYVSRIELAPPPPMPESRPGRTLHRSYAINNQYPGGDRYDGTGVSVAVNDDGIVGPHIDFRGRIDQTAVSVNYGGHGDMVAGIVGGAGNIDPTITGMAPGAFIHIRQYTSALNGTVSLHQNDDVMIFCSSYSDGCNAYTHRSEQVDREIHDNPSLIQVFSAGNSATANCSYGAGAGWGNITGGHKIGKNVIATANVFEDGEITPSSSRGPANDGRIKPDIAAHGNYQMSTSANNGYSAGSGTSAAAPGITGVLAQLYQAYREFNGGSNPNSGLMKAAMLNTAQDKGNVGPDYVYGWGIVNAYRAFKTLENQTYLSGTIAQNGQNTHNVTIPTGVKEARIMLYWLDPEGSTFAAQSLVNDLDMIVTNGGNTYYPWILDPTPNATNLSAPATHGVDNLNNMEQVALTDPVAGTYTVTIDGSVIPQGPQEYFVLYEFIYDEITLMYPLGGEGWVPFEQELIHWDAYGNGGTFSISRSIDGGLSWNHFASLPGSARYFALTVPNVQTGKALIRVERGGVSGQSDTTFSISRIPTNLAISAVCPTYLTFIWDSVAGATAYDVFYLGNTYMDSVGTTTGTSFSVPISNPNDEHWVSVRAVGPNGLRSRRAIAISDTGGLRNCAGLNDVQVFSIVSPTGAACEGSMSLDVEVVLLNADSIPLGGFPVSYQIDGGNIVTEVFNGIIPPNGGATNFTFATPISGNTGEFELTAWTSLSGDVFMTNDSASTQFIITPLIDSYPYIETFTTGTNGWSVEGANASWELGSPSGTVINSPASPPNSWVTNLSGYYNLNENSWVIGPCFDFSSLVNPRIRMNIWWDLVTGSDGVVLQSSIDNGGSWQNVGALNDPGWYNNATISANPGNQPVGWSGAGGDGSGGWMTVTNSLSGLGGQPLVRLRIAMASGNLLVENGFGFDDIVIDETQPNLDLAASYFVSPSSLGCGTANTPVEIAVENVGTVTVSSLSAGFAVNGGAYTVENFTVSIPPGSTQTLTFSTTANMSTGALLEAYIAAVADTNTLNDSISMVVNLAISNFPYIEDFEDGGILDTLWAQGTDEDQDWLIWSGATPSFSTGPSVDHTTGTTSGYYLYTEDSNPNEHFPIDLYTPCFDIDGTINPTMRFWYHSNVASSNSDANELLIQISSGGIWTTIDSIGHAGNNWNEWVGTLNNFQGNGPIQVRFRSRTDNGSFVHDIAIDDFSITTSGGTGTDLALTNILFTNTTICSDSAQMLDIVVQNVGSTTQGLFDLTLVVASLTPTLYAFSLNDTLLPNETQTLTIGPIDMSAAGSYTVQGTLSLAGDNNPNNNSFTTNITVIPVWPSPSVSNTIACDTGEIVTLDAMGNGSMYWYDSPTASTAIAVGNTFSPPPITQSTTFYVEQGGGADFVGPADPSIGNTSFYVNYSDGLVFNVTGASDIMIDSVTCYVASAGNVVVNITDNSGNLLGSSLYMVDATTAASNGGKVRIPVNILVPSGTNYQMNANGTNVGALTRNSSGATYPYTDSNGRISITRTINNLPISYYFFYDWQVSLQECPSERLPVEVYLARDVFEPNDVTPVPLPSIGTNRNAYICDAADVDLFEVMVTSDEPNLRVSLSGETDMMEIRLMDASMNVLANASNSIDDIVVIANGLAAGAYIIEVQGSSGYMGSDGYNLRAQHSDEPFAIRTNIDVAVFEESFVLYPNPNTGAFYLEFVTNASVEAYIRVVDIYGKAILREHDRTHAGENRLSLNLGEVASGLYFVELQVDGKKFAKRIQVSR